MNTIECKACGHQNDLTRVFCQNCGVRLEKPAPADASVAPQAGPAPAPTPVAAKSTPPKAPSASASTSAKPVKPSKPKIVTKSSKGDGPSLFSILYHLTSSILFGAVVAAIIVGLRAPDNIPEPVAANTYAAQQSLQLIRNAAGNTFPETVKLPQLAANNYLAVNLPAVGGGKNVGYLTFRFQRAFLIYGPQEFQFVSEVQSKLTTLYVGFRLRVDNEVAGTKITVVGGNIGRLKVPEFAVPLLERFLGKVIVALEEPIELFKKSKKIQISSDMAEIDWSGSAQSRPAP